MCKQDARNNEWAEKAAKLSEEAANEIVEYKQRIESDSNKALITYRLISKSSSTKQSK